MLCIWCNARLADAAGARLAAGVAPHRLLLSSQLTGNLAAAGPDPLLAEADIAFGQPDPDQLLNLPRLRWIQLSSAGYTRYDRSDIRDALRRRGAVLTNSSSVFNEPCAEHLLAFMLANARAFPRRWPINSARAPGPSTTCGPNAGSSSANRFCFSASAPSPAGSWNCSILFT